MMMYMIHKRFGNKAEGQSVPLLWDVNQEVRERVGRNPACLQAFPERSDALEVMAVVQDLFDMDDEVAACLHVVDYQSVGGY